MEENSKVRGLGNELVRRFLNTEEGLLGEEATKLIDSYGVKLMTSGYRRDQVIRIVVSGIRCYRARVLRCEREGRRLYRTATQSYKTRRRQKLLGKLEWYRKKRQEDGGEGVSGQEPRMPKPKGDAECPTRTVIFVGFSPNGELAKRVREELGDLEQTLGFRVRVVEKTGTPLRLLFSPTKLWEGVMCGREACTTCNQGGEKLPPCTKRSLVYESVCRLCNPTISTKEEAGRYQDQDKPSVYVGETSKSIAERSADHLRDYRDKKEDSHILKHHQLHHGGEGEPSFFFRVVKYHSSALRRQVGEAVRIKRRGLVLNSKSEYSRCQITRLTLEALEVPVPLETPVVLEEWETGVVRDTRRPVGDKTMSTKPLKRGGEQSDQPGSSKRARYSVMDDSWGGVEAPLVKSPLKTPSLGFLNHEQLPQRQSGRRRRKWTSLGKERVSEFPSVFQIAKCEWKLNQPVRVPLSPNDIPMSLRRGYVPPLALTWCQDNQEPCPDVQEACPDVSTPVPPVGEIMQSVSPACLTQRRHQIEEKGILPSSAKPEPVGGSKPSTPPIINKTKGSKPKPGGGIKPSSPPHINKTKGYKRGGKPLPILRNVITNYFQKKESLAEQRKMMMSKGKDDDELWGNENLDDLMNNIHEKLKEDNSKKDADDGWNNVDDDEMSTIQDDMMRKKYEDDVWKECEEVDDEELGALQDKMMTIKHDDDRRKLMTKHVNDNDDDDEPGRVETGRVRQSPAESGRVRQS